MKEMRIGRMTLQIRAKADDPLTETARLVDRFPVATDEQWASWKSQGHCGKPASAYSLYCDNHEPLHHNDDPMTPVSQAIDNRPGGRQRVVMCAHVTTPKQTNNDNPQIPATHTPTTNATTNARTEKEITMSTINTAVNADQDYLDFLAWKASRTPTASVPANVPATPTASVPANVPATPTASVPANVPATTNAGKTAAEIFGLPQTATITFGDGLQGAGICEFKTFKPDEDTGYSNHGYFASFKVMAANGQRFQFTGNIAAIKPQEIRDLKAAAKAAKAAKK